MTGTPEVRESVTGVGDVAGTVTGVPDVGEAATGAGDVAEAVTGVPEAVETEPEVPDAAETAARSGRRLLSPLLGGAGGRALPWLLTLGVAIVVLLEAGTPALDIARYGAYWGLAVVLPGLLVARAAVGTRGNWPEDVALGAVVGLGLELVFFMLWSVFGLQRQLWLWPVVVVVIFAAVPRLRQHWRIGSPRPLPCLWSWGVASAITVCTLLMRSRALVAPLPPAGGFYDQDVVWHLSVVHELTRAFPPLSPQVSGEVLRYHWFSHIHMAAAHLISGAPVATVALRLWILPLLALTALIGARLAIELSGRWWSGPVAAWALIVFMGTALLPVAGESGVIFPTSPSEVFVLPLFLGVSVLIVRALRGLRLGWGWIILLLLLVAAGGAKPTAMPLLLAGTCLAGLILVVQRSRQWRAALSVTAMVAVILPLSALYVAGSDSTSKITFFDYVEWIALYHFLTGSNNLAAVGPILPEGLMDLSGRSLAILFILLLVPLGANVGRLVAFGWLGSRRMRSDPAGWFMAGIVIAGWAVYLVLAHPGNSQSYFLRLANPVASVFGAWALAAAVPATVRSGRRVAAVLAGGTLLGIGVVTAAHVATWALPPFRPSSLYSTAVAFIVPLAVTGIAIVAGVLAWMVARRRVPDLRGWGSALVLAALVLGAPAQSVIPLSGKALVDVASGRPVASPGYRLSPDAAASMAWVEQHTAEDAVVATNRHCLTGPAKPRCLALASWVSGIGGRRTVLEGWGNSSAANWTVRAPVPFPELLAANDAVFTDPSARTIDRIRQQYGATWLVADKTAGKVSPKLAQFAIPRFSSGAVTVYELR